MNLFKTIFYFFICSHFLYSHLLYSHIVSAQKSSVVSAQKNFDLLHGFSSNLTAQMHYDQFLVSFAHKQFLGTETGNGGDSIRDFFIHEGLKLSSMLASKMTFSIYYEQKIDPMFFAKTLNIKHIKVSTKTPLIDHGGSEVEALVLNTKSKADLKLLQNYIPSSLDASVNQYLILDPRKWLKNIQIYKQKPHLIQRLILHEILRLNNIKDDNYVVTEKLTQQLLYSKTETTSLFYKKFFKSTVFSRPGFSFFNLQKVNNALAVKTMQKFKKLHLADYFSELVFYSVKENTIKEIKLTPKKDILKNYVYLLTQINTSIKIASDAINGKYTQYIIQKNSYPTSVLLDKLKNTKKKLEKALLFLELQLQSHLILIVKAFRSQDTLTKLDFLVCEDEYTNSTKRIILQSLHKKLTQARVMSIQQTKDPIAQIIGDVFQVHSITKGVYNLRNLTNSKGKSMTFKLNLEQLYKTKTASGTLFIPKWLKYEENKEVKLKCTLKSNGVDITEFKMTSYF